MTSWVFWLSAGFAPFLLFLVGVGIKFLLDEPDHTQWLDDKEVNSPDFFIDWLVTHNKGKHGDVLTYGVLDLSDSVSRDVRKEIDGNDRYEFVTTVLDLQADEYERMQANIRDEIESDRGSFLERLDQLRRLSLSEPRELTLAPLLDVGSNIDPNQFDALTNCADEFSDWWSHHRDVVASVVPTISTNFFSEIRGEETTEAELQELLKSKQIAGYFVIPENVSDAVTELVFVSRSDRLKTPVLTLVNWYRSIVTNALRKNRSLAAGVAPNWLGYGMTRTTISTEKLATDRATPSKRDYPNYFLWVLIYVMVVLYSIGMQSLSLSVVEEKSSKLMDQLMSNLNPSELLDAKVWGNSLVHLTMLGIWIVLFALFLEIPWSQNLGSFDEMFQFFFQPSVLVHFLLFNLLLYGFYGYALTAISSSYDHVKNARRTMGFFIIFLVFPFAFSAISVQFTSSELILNGLSLIPPCIPYIMVARSTTTLPDWPMYLAIFAVMIFSIGVVRLLSITPFAVGIGGEGKRL